LLLGRNALPKNEREDHTSDRYKAKIRGHVHEVVRQKRVVLCEIWSEDQEVIRSQQFRQMAVT
jgi:uncharacterized protein YndB with AHSA1/START domain